MMNSSTQRMTSRNMFQHFARNFTRDFFVHTRGSVGRNNDTTHRFAVEITCEHAVSISDLHPSRSSSFTVGER